MSVKLKTPSNGSVTLAPEDTASDVTITVPATSAELLTDSAGILNIGSGQIYKDASGNVGIGTLAPIGFGGGFTTTQVNGSSGGYVLVSQAGTTSIGEFGTDSGLVYVGSRSTNTPIVFRQNGSTERMRIDSSGNLLVGTTTRFSSERLSVKNTGANDLIFANTTGGGTGYVYQTATSSGLAAYFMTSAGQAGLISCSGGTTSYASGSDYRLKDNIRPLEGALEKVAALKPVAFEWKSDGSYGESFVAHELQEVCPAAVTGEKDAVQVVDEFDEEGNKIGTKEVPRYQGVDTSFLVATLTAAIQELNAKVDSLQAEVDSLKGGE